MYSLSLSLSVVAMASGSDMNQLSFVGLVGMCDPLRPGVKEAVKELLSGEVDVKMITGDAKETGEAIGETPYYSWKFLPGEKCSPFSLPCSHWRNFYPAIFLYHVNEALSCKILSAFANKPEHAE